MKKIILSIGIFIVLLIFPFSVSAQSDDECFNKYVVGEMSKCGNEDGDAGIACQNQVTDAYLACTGKKFSCRRAPDGTCLPGTAKIESNDFSCERAANGTCIPGTETFKSGDDGSESPFDEAVCHDTCQTNYDTCFDKCGEQESAVPTQIPDDPQACTDKCRAVYDSAYKALFDGCFDTKYKCTMEIINRKGPGDSRPCWASPGDIIGPCNDEIQEKCWKPYDACLDQAKLEQNTCLEDCLPKTDQVALPDCYTACENTRSSCDQSCRGTVQVNERSQPSEKPQVGVSSRNFQALVRANAEYQKAQADLEQIKASNDPRWVAKKDFASNPQTDSDSFDQGLQKVKVGLERTRDGGTAWQDIKELYGLATKGKTGAYGPISAITDVASGVTIFTEQVGKGVSVDNAFTKASLDVGAPSALIMYPPAFVADKVATIPDRVLNALGYPEKQGPRIVTGFLKKNSPSGFVELTTDSMIKTGNLTNVGGAVLVAAQDIQSADGIGGKLLATGEFVYTVVGAVPVAIVIGVRDYLFSPPLTQQATNYIYNWLTSSN